jgi:hypothetical protein
LRERFVATRYIFELGLLPQGEERKLEDIRFKMQNPPSPGNEQERSPENPEEAGEEGEGTSQGDNLMLRKMRMVPNKLGKRMVSASCLQPGWSCAWSCA